MNLSIVIPAFNEERELPHCLASIDRAVQEVGGRDPASAGLVLEIIVADNNSTDATAVLARVAGARVVFEPVNQIARARNAGAAVATGDWLLFLDADSRLRPESLRELLDSIESGEVAAGGCTIALTDVPRWVERSIAFFNLCMRVVKWAPGCFLFCRRDAFRELTGFSTELFAAEEIDLSRRLKRWARSHGKKFQVLSRHPHPSSGRKIRLFTTGQVLLHVWRSILQFRTYNHDRSRLGWYYESPRSARPGRDCGGSPGLRGAR